MKTNSLRELIEWMRPVCGEDVVALIAAAEAELDVIEQNQEWNAALEAAAETADGGPLYVRGVLKTPSERIIALKRTP